MLESEKHKDTLTIQFNKSAAGVASQCSLNLHDVTSAYENKKESLNLAFDTMSTAKSDRSSWIGWSVVWAIFIPPIALYTGYKAYESHRQLSETEDQVRDEVSRWRGARSAPAPV